MATLSSIITPSNVETASSTSTLTNKTISGSSNTITNVPLSTAVTGTLPVANGGTGAASLTANNVLLGNGTSAVQVVAPGSSGNVLTSNGTTWQSTAPAPSGGSVTATASGAITSSAAAVVNSDGTVSAITPTAGSGATLSSATVNPSTFPSINGSAMGTVVYGLTTGAVVAFYVGSSGANSYVYASIGTSNGVSFTWGAPFTVFSQACNHASTGGFDSANNRYWCCVKTTGGDAYFVGVELKADGTYNTIYSVLMQGSASYPTMVVNAAGTKGISAWYSNNDGFLYVKGFSFSAGSPYISQGSAAVYASSFYSSTDSRDALMLAINADGSRAMGFYGDTNYYPVVGLISITSNNATLLNTAVIQSVSSGGYLYGITYNSVEDKYVAVWGVSSPSWESRAATITVSGSSMSMGTVLNGGLPLPYVSWKQVLYNATLNNVMVFGDGGSNRLTISGTALTAGAGMSFSPATGGTIRGYSFLSDSFSQIQAITSGAAYTMQVTIARPYTTTLTATNLLGISDATYSNGQTATIKTVGSTKNGFSNLTAGAKYNVNGTGNLQPFYAIGGSYAGLAVSSTTLLIKG